MIRLKPYGWELISGCTYLLGLIIYFAFVRDLIPALYQGTAPAWFESIVSTIYPRFLVEKSRFDVTFFLEKADQVIIRLGLVLSVALIVIVLTKVHQTFQRKVLMFWSRSQSIQSIQLLSRAFCIIMLIYVVDWYSSLIDLSKLDVFYEPILLFKLFHIPLASTLVMNLLVGLFIISLLFLLFDKWTWHASIISAICFLLFQGYYQSFGKIAHTFSPWVYAFMLMPFLVFEIKKAKQNSSVYIQNWPLLLIQLAIASCYLFSGLEKLLISQLAWLNPETFVTYIKLHQAPTGLWLIQFKWLTYLLPLGALIFQLGFIFCVFVPRLRWFFIPMGLIFHWGTFLLLGVGWWIHPWQVAYLFFIDWEWVIKRISTINTDSH